MDMKKIKLKKRKGNNEILLFQQRYGTTNEHSYVSLQNKPSVRINSKEYTSGITERRLASVYKRHSIKHNEISLPTLAEVNSSRSRFATIWRAKLYP